MVGAGWYLYRLSMGPTSEFLKFYEINITLTLRFSSMDKNQPNSLELYQAGSNN